MPDQKKPNPGQNPNPNQNQNQNQDRNKQGQQDPQRQPQGAPGQQRREDPKDPNKKVDIDDEGERITQRTPQQGGDPNKP